MKALTSVILKNARRKEQKLGATFNEKVLAVFSFMIVFSFFAMVMIIASIFITKKLSEIHQTYAFINLLLFVNFIILFTKSIFESLNVLYFSKDLRILLRMPLKPIDILHSKILNMIISEYSMEVIMLAIPIIVYGIYTKVSFMFYIYMIGILLILPIIPIMIVSFVISIIMRFTNIIKNKSKVLYITVIFASLILSIFTMFIDNSNTDMSVSNFENMVLNANGLAENIANHLVLIKPIMNTLLNYNNINGLINFLIYLAESLVVYIAILYLMSKVYLKGAIGTVINSNREKIDNKPLELKDFKKRTKYKSYIYKELKTLVRTPIFCIQCLIMPIAYPLIVFSVIVLFLNFANKLGAEAMSSFYDGLLKSSGLVAFFAVGQVLYMMNFTSIIAFSRESKNSILVKYLPLHLQKQFNLKIRIGVLTNMLSSILVSVCYYVCLKNLLNTFLVFIILMQLNIIGEKYKALIDLKNPQINWDSEYTMMKQNTNVLYELFYTFIVIAILAVASFVIRNISLFLIVVLGINLIINTFINEHIYQKQDIIFRNVF